MVEFFCSSKETAKERRKGKHRREKRARFVVKRMEGVEKRVAPSSVHSSRNNEVDKMHALKRRREINEGASGLLEIIVSACQKRRYA